MFYSSLVSFNTFDTPILSLLFLSTLFCSSLSLSLSLPCCFLSVFSSPLNTSLFLCDNFLPSPISCLQFCFSFVQQDAIRASPAAGIPSLSDWTGWWPQGMVSVECLAMIYDMFSNIQTLTSRSFLMRLGSKLKFEIFSKINYPYFDRCSFLAANYNFSYFLFFYTPTNIIFFFLLYLPLYFVHESSSCQFSFFPPPPLLPLYFVYKMSWFSFFFNNLFPFTWHFDFYILDFFIQFHIFFLNS